MKTLLWIVWPVFALGPVQDGQPEETPAQDVEIPAGRLGKFPGWLPEGASKTKPCPLIVACHGHGDSASNFLACMKPLAKEAGVALLVPEGVEKVGQSAFGWNNFPDRGKVIEAAVRAMIKSHPVDPKRILWFGHSAGTWVCCEDGASVPDICHGIILTAGPCATLGGNAKGPRPKVCMFLGTKDPNFQCWNDHLKALKAANVAYSANRVTDLEHSTPDDKYLAGAIGWLLGCRGTEHEESTLPKQPKAPEDRGCRHLLVRYKGAEGAGDTVKRSEKDAMKEAEKHAAALRKEKADKRAERVAKSSEAEGAADDKGALSAESAAPYGPMMRWTCWTLASNEVRVIKSPAGWHAVWAEK